MPNLKLKMSRCFQLALKPTEPLNLAQAVGSPAQAAGGKAEGEQG